MSLDLTSFDYALEAKYSPLAVKRALYDENPLLALMPKKKNFGGKNYTFGIRYGVSAGRSATFATAQANATNHAGDEFVVTRKKDYAVFTIDNETLEASKGDGNALFEAAATEIDSAMYTLKRSAAQAVAGSGTGRVGQLAASSGFSGSTLTLSDANDVVNLEVGMKIVLSSTDGGGSVRSGTLTISGINRTTGVITTSAAVTTGISAAANSDYIFIEGDYDAKMKGVAAWVPTSDPTSTSFFGINRTVDTVRLAGFRFNGSALNPDEALVKALVQGGREGCKPTHYFTSYAQYAALDLALGSKVTYTDLKEAETGVGFRGIVIQGPKKPVTVIPDNTISGDFAWGLNMGPGCWELKTLGDFPRWLDTDTLKVIRQASADGIEGRLGYYGNVICHAPGDNICVQLPAAT